MTHNTYDFTGKSVLVTGAGSGIGKAIALAFLDNGAHVTIVGRTVEKLEATLAGRPADRTLAIGADVGDPADVARVVRETTDRFGALDVVVTNAAAFAAGDFVEQGFEEWQRISRTNVDGFVLLAQAALPELEKSGGNLVAVSSVSALRGDWGQAMYNASKATAHNLVQSLALDYGSRGVRLNAVSPSFTVTELTASMADDRAFMDAATNRIALGRPGRPEDIAPAVLFLASADAGYITGTTVTVDGGTTASTGQAHAG